MLDGQPDLVHLLNSIMYTVCETMAVLRSENGNGRSFVEIAVGFIDRLTDEERRVTIRMIGEITDLLRAVDDDGSALELVDFCMLYLTAIEVQ